MVSSRWSNRGICPLAVLLLLLSVPLACSRRQVDPGADPVNSNESVPASVASSDTQPGKWAGGSSTEGATSIGDLVETLGDAVVFITVSDVLGADIAVGTGCVIDRSGLIATNRHVIEEGVSARVQLRSGVKYPVAGVLAADESRDLAILLVEQLPESVGVFELREPPALRQGDRLIAIGHPMEFQFTVTDGILSALRRTEELPLIYQQLMHFDPDTEWIQTTAAISNGSSGGPLLAANGHLVGINTWIAPGRDLGFAISVKHLIALRRQVASHVTKLPLPDAPVILGTRAAILSKNYEKEWGDLLQELLQARTVEAQQQLWEMRNPLPVYVAKCLEIMEASDSESDRIDAFLLAHRLWADSDDVLKMSRRHFAGMYAVASAHLAGSEALGRVVALVGKGPYSPEMDRLLRQVFRSHPSESVRAGAGLALFRAMRAEPRGELYVPEMIEILERLKRLFPDVRLEGRLVSGIADEELGRLRAPRAGGMARELVGEDQGGNRLRLSDHRGGVVVLDFWADGSPHSRGMYTHYRELVARLRDEPFHLLGVNCDETPDRSARLVESGVVTWTTLYDGLQGQVQRGWSLDSVPANFVIDGKGVIRFMNVWGEELDDAVQSLLEDRLLQFPADVVPWESQWRWYSGAAPPPPDWPSPRFDDAQWRTGRAPLGYGRAGVRTSLDYGDMDNKYLVACFRQTFEVTDPTASRLILQLDADDGAMVYLNGQEVYRENLPETVDWHTPAIRPAEQPITVDLDVILEAGMNTIAVAVHQVSPSSGDLYFDMALSSRGPDPRAVVDARSPSTRMRFCQLAAGLALPDQTWDDGLASLSVDDDLRVRTWALAARIQRATDPDAVEIPDADEETRNARRLLADMLNSRIWPLVQCGGADRSAYDRTLRAAHAMWRLGRTGTAADANIANTYGVAFYRAGQFEKAVEYLGVSNSLLGENPLDLSFMALSLEQLGRHEEAREAYDKAAAFVGRERWAAMDAAALALEEAKVLFGR